MSENFNNFNSKFNVDELMVIQTDYWRWSVRPVQCTVGAGILSLKRPAESMSELTEEEGADLIKITKIIETALKSAYGMDKINYIMLMMVDFHIHYHVVPRYSRGIEFAGQTFKDMGWPKPPILDAESVGQETLLKIRDYLKSHINE